MNAVQITNTAWEAILNALVAASAPWDGVKVHLYKTNVVVGPTLDIGSIVEAEFTGYAASSTVVWGTPGFLPNGAAIVTGDAKVFTVGATPTVLNTIYGWYVTDSTGAILRFLRAFDSPVILGGAGQQLVVLPAYPAYLSQ